jgi:ABC-type phosphate/phosphonate transport system substrate-binding protein
VQQFRDQAAIGFVLDAKLADVGAVMSYSGVGREWDKKGRVLLDGPRQPYMPLVASPKVTAAELAQLRAALVTLDQTPAGQAILMRIGIPGFETRALKDLISLLNWLGQ